MRETAKDILLCISIICVIVGAIAYANTRDANDSYLNAVQASIPCVSDNDNTLAYSYYENGNLTCEKHEVYTSEDVKQRLAALKLAYPVKVKTH